MLTGTGTAGAYHAGVLRALHEAGVKIDIVAGRGIGVIGALFMAVDGGARLWEPQGLWRSDGATRLYRWRATLRAAVWTLGAALASLLLPLAVLVGAIVAYPVSFLLQVVGVDAGERVASGYARLVAAIFDPAALPALLPRAILFLLGLLLVILTAGAARAMLRTRARRRARGALWWRLLGTPLDVTRVVEWFTDGLWQIMRGAARIAKPAPDDLGARFAELLADNVGQPGFRELVVLTHDVDARRDLVFALLSEPHRRGFFLRRVGGEDGRHLETVDLAAAARRHAVDALSSALSLPVVTQPHLVTFTPDGPWRGETHRVCDRPGRCRPSVGGGRPSRSGAGRLGLGADRPARTAHALSRPPRCPWARGRVPGGGRDGRAPGCGRHTGRAVPGDLRDSPVTQPARPVRLRRVLRRAVGPAPVAHRVSR